MFIPGLDLQIAPAISDDTPELLAMGLRTEDGRLGRAQGASQARKPLPRRLDGAVRRRLGAPPPPRLLGGAFGPLDWRVATGGSGNGRPFKRFCRCVRNFCSVA